MQEVLVVPTESVKEVNDFQGFLKFNESLLMTLLVDNEYQPRDLMEKDPSFKQIIPYGIITTADNKVFCYPRGGSEERLHENYSVGVGGHIDKEDSSEGNPILRCLKRELQEELTLGTDPRIHYAGFINDDSNEVGQVHLGVVFLIAIPSSDTVETKDETSGGKFVDMLELLRLSEDNKLETWSDICLRKVLING